MNLPAHIARCFPKREANSHKGTYGTLLSVCGSYGMVGAAVLAARAAGRSGVGKVVAALPDTAYPIAAAQLPEVVFTPLPNGTANTLHVLMPHLQNCTALLIGCGLGMCHTTEERVQALLSHAACPVVLDADGINAAARHISILEAEHPPLILTPHPKEMSRLLACSVEEVERDRIAAAQTAARRFDATVVLKGSGTVIAEPSGRYTVNETGNPGMAVAGSGDVLAGIVGSLLAQGLSPWDAAVCGAYLHGAAGDRAAARISQHALLPTDILDELGDLFLILEQ